MKLRGIEFGNVLGASGVQGFFGEGYWFHKYLRALGILNFSGMSFVSKTATAHPTKGNAALNSNYTLKDRFPSCIKVDFFAGAMLNAAGLSNPGINALLSVGEWQKRKAPFLISLMPVAKTRLERLLEVELMVKKISRQKFSSPFGLQINLSCPNTKHSPAELISESWEILDAASDLNVPLIPKYSIASAPFKAILDLESHPFCDAICVSNTIPYNWLNFGEIEWGSEVSPLAQFGGGGVSGKPLRPFVCAWIEKLRGMGFSKPINGGGGILSCHDVDCYHKAGASSIFLGSVATLRPWRVQKIIRHANQLTWR